MNEVRSYGIPSGVSESAGHHWKPSDWGGCYIITDSAHWPHPLATPTSREVKGTSMPTAPERVV